MAAPGILVVSPEERHAAWTIARSYLDDEAVRAEGLASDEFCLLGHTLRLCLYPDPDGTGSSIIVESRERGAVTGTLAINGESHDLEHDFSSGVRAVQRWPGLVIDGGALEIAIRLVSVGEEAMRRACGEMVLVEEVKALKVEKSTMESRIAALDCELLAVRADLEAVTDARNAYIAMRQDLTAENASLKARVDSLVHLEKELPIVEASRDENRAESLRFFNECEKLRKALAVLTDEHETLKERFLFAQELKAKTEVAAHNALTENSLLKEGVSGNQAALKKQIEALMTDRDKLLASVKSSSADREILREEVQALEATREQLQSRQASLAADNQSLNAQVADLTRQRAELQNQIEQTAPKKKKSIFG